MSKFTRAGIAIILLGILISACTVSIFPDIDPEETGRPGQIDYQRTIPGWNQLLPYDAIRPVYDPRFIPADQANLQSSELVMGVAWDNQAKAYPVTVLRLREMVNDEMAGIPYLVSW